MSCRRSEVLACSICAMMALARSRSVSSIFCTSRLMVASWTPEIDDLASKSRSASRASGACGRGTWGVLAGLVGNELIEIGGGKVPARALGAVANHDIFQIAIGGVTVERFDRAAELGSGLPHQHFELCERCLPKVLV